METRISEGGAAQSWSQSGNEQPSTATTPAAPRGKIRAVDEGVAPDQWRRVHPVSPVLNTWKVILAILAFVTYQNLDIALDLASQVDLTSTGVRWLILAGVGTLLLVVLVAGVYSWLAWRAMSWAVTDSAVWYRQGILMRSQRHARLDRIQAVDIVHPLLGRLLGLGRLNIEVAGGANSHLTFGFLRTAELDATRAEILALSAGLKAAVQPGPTPPPAPGFPAPGAPSGTAGIPAPSGIPSAADGVGAAPPSPMGGLVAPERPLYEVPPSRLLASLMLSPTTVTMLLMAIAGIAGAVFAALRWGPAALSSAWGVIPILLGIGSYLWHRFAGEFGFRAAVSPDGIRIRRGLTETRSQTIPPRRVHAVRIIQPWLWRPWGWYRVLISQAGYGGATEQEANKGAAADVLVPVGSRAEAETALWLVVRDLGVADPRAFVDAALDGVREHGGFIPVPARMRPLDPLVFARRAVQLTSTVVAVRDGWLTRSVVIAPIERLQSASVESGPLERYFRVASLHMHIVPGRVVVRAEHVDEEVAAQLLDQLTTTSRVRRTSEPPEKWMQRALTPAFASAVEPMRQEVSDAS